MSSEVIHQQARDFVAQSLAQVGLKAEVAPRELRADVAVFGQDRQQTLIRILVREAPHRRGGGANLGLHWMLSNAPAEYVALVDLSRQFGWLLPTAEFQARARPYRGGRHHLDWIVARMGRTRTRVPDEGEFARYLFERTLPELARP